jgi:hypothetical protein
MRDQVLSLWQNGVDVMNSPWIVEESEAVPLLEDLSAMDPVVQ